MSLNFEHNVLKQRYGRNLDSSHASDLSCPGTYAETVASNQYQIRASLNDEETLHDEILSKIRGADLWVVNARKRNGLIINKGFLHRICRPRCSHWGWPRYRMQ